MAEGDSDSTQKRKPVTMSFAEINSLVDRLTARATSILLRDQPQQARDLAQAAVVIRAMARHFNHSDQLTIENGNGA
jgi:hypothetical protein